MDANTETAIIGTDHQVSATWRDNDATVLLRVERKEGSGMPRYETLILTADEASAALQVLMDTVG